MIGFCKFESIKENALVNIRKLTQEKWLPSYRNNIYPTGVGIKSLAHAVRKIYYLK
jgi:hypothetical protein